jgi:hypothetical protein
MRHRKGTRTVHRAPPLDPRAPKFRFRFRSEKQERFLNIPVYGVPWNQLVHEIARSFGCKFSAMEKASSLDETFLEATTDHGIPLTPTSVVMPNVSLVIRRLPVHYLGAKRIKQEISLQAAEQVVLPIVPRRPQGPAPSRQGPRIHGKVVSVKGPLPMLRPRGPWIPPGRRLLAASRKG